MQPKVYAALEGKAVCMQKSTDELAGMLLEAIVGREIYDAVLDIGAVTAWQGTLAHSWDQTTYECAAQHDGGQGKIEPVTLAIKQRALVESHGLQRALS